jgi:hypothetical protein
MQVVQVTEFEIALQHRGTYGPNDTDIEMAEVMGLASCLMLMQTSLH